MKHIIFVTTLFIIATCTSCNNNNATVAGNKENAATGNTPSSASTGNAVFSYSLDGTKVSGGEVDELQIDNVAEIYQPPSDPGNKELRFSLNDGEEKNTDIVAHSLLFTIPYKTGTLDLTPDQQTNWFINLFLPGGQVVGSRLVYGQESFHITITNISSVRISGTFSGTMKKSEADKSSAKSELTITDGKFDIPIRNTK